jgi:two-component system, OmpR family, sensor histidine kinase TctE
MLTPLLLLWPISLALTWLVAQNIAGKPFDRALEYNVQALAKLVTVREGRVSFSLPAPAREILRADDSDLLYYQVRKVSGELLGGEFDLPLPANDELSLDGEVRLREDVMQGEGVRVAYTWVAVDTPRTEVLLIQVAETLEKRKTLATEIVKGVMVPQFVTLPLAVLLVWLALVRGIRPLELLERRIRARKADDMSPLDESTVPEEVAPLVSSINDLLQRLKVSLSTQKRFLADAAHQLKTPLAGLRMQAELAQRQRPNAEEHQEVAQANWPRQQTGHPHGQPAAGAGARRDNRPQPGQIAASIWSMWSARPWSRESLPRALDKQIDLGYEGPARPIEAASRMDGNGTLLKEMVRNLIDNAINYTPEARPGHGARAGRPLLAAIAHAAGGGHRPGHPRGRARAGVPALLPRTGHQRGRLGPGPGHRGRDRAAARGQRQMDSCAPTADPLPGAARDRAAANRPANRRRSDRAWPCTTAAAALAPAWVFCHGQERQRRGHRRGGAVVITSWQSPCRIARDKEHASGCGPSLAQVLADDAGQLEHGHLRLCRTPASNLASALIARLLVASCRPWALM